MPIGQSRHRLTRRLRIGDYGRSRIDKDDAALVRLSRRRWLTGGDVASLGVAAASLRGQHRDNHEG
jgi:hypothetical protein